MFREIFGRREPEFAKSTKQINEESLIKLEDTFRYKKAELIALKSLDLPWSTYLKRDKVLREELDELQKKRADLLARIDSDNADAERNAI